MPESPSLDPHSYPQNSVTVLIGANGSGKSRQLRELCLTSLRRGENVVAVSPGPYDRFRGIRDDTFHFFGSRLGPAAVRKIIGSVILRASTGDPKVLVSFTRALDHTGFDAAIGIRVPRLRVRHDELPAHARERDPLLMELERALDWWGERAGAQEIVPLRLESYSFTELHSLNVGFIVQHEPLLRRLGIRDKIEYFFMRNGETIPLMEACSGEIAYVTAFAFIAAHVTPNAIIAIDEPETSLHPTWQKGYVSMLMDLFSLYEPRVVISTHSPLLISGAEAMEDNVRVLELRAGELHPFNHRNLSLEEMYDRLFKLITPKNHHLSKRAVSLLNDLSTSERTLDNVLNELKELRDRSYDKRQRAAIDQIEQLARKVDQEKK